ncbi:rhamnogalacturonan lyase [Streptomyces sp. 7-21]|uniref:rhamnogalacturonan lyase n=1 Tax=Streptomyces sp. 7-21 TaxID=2802283 RepID=UPI00191DA7D8|nr:rhamnogalacturonan lyase [Streptomyces sp. 7-21]MBL1068185.1 rhamnogalacturonan lyase [Streptomyces sp. 7-21]
MALSTLLAGIMVATAVGGAQAGSSADGRRGSGGGRDAGPVQLERLDRGLVAVATDEGVFLSWRLLASEVTGHTATGLAGADFRVYRDGERVATVTDSTNYLDEGASPDSEYRVAAVVDGEETDRSEPVSPWSQGYYEIPLTKPEGGVTPAGEEYTYGANDMSVADLDGDGQYEYVVKWYPSNAKDVSQTGYTGNTYIDAYELDGTLLYRIDLGVNIRSGAHYTQFPVYDFDGDGRAELMMKTAPGTSVTRFEDGEPVAREYLTMPRADRLAGYSHQDDYRLSAEDYRDHLAGMFQDWHEHPEVQAGNWPATVEEALGAQDELSFSYPLSRADAGQLADYFIDVYAPSRSERNDLRSFEGFVLDGPEYLTVFDGATGGELQTVPYQPGRGDDGLMWGDYAMSRIEPGNRVDRFLASVAYLDGRHPSAVFARGYYTRTTLVAYRWDGDRLREEWYVDSGHAPMSNPFNDAPHGVDGTDPEYGTLTTQGFHSLSAADVDGDGRQEIVYGSATLDDDGSLLYSSFGEMPGQSADPGASARLGHGDAMHVTDIDPGRPGLEIFTVHEGAAYAPYGYALRDAATGEVLWGGYTGEDTGRGMIGDVDPDVPGIEVWAGVPEGGAGGEAGMWSASGEELSAETPGTNQSIRWAGDLTTQYLTGATTETYETPAIEDWRRGTLLTARDTTTNNWTKGNPSLVADILGDWREELLLPTADSTAMRIYLSTELTGHKLYTLMHDPQYRVEVARQQTAYNQPAHPSFYLASDMDFADVPVPSYYTPGGVPALEDAVRSYVRSGDVSLLAAARLLVVAALAEHHLDHGRTARAVSALECFTAIAGHPWPGRVSGEARAALIHQAGSLLAQLT